MSVVVIVLPKMEDAKKIRKILMGHGFPQVFAYATASAALSEIREHESGMVISGYHLKDMYYTELAEEQFAVSFMGILDSHMMMLGREQDEEHGLVMTDQRTYEIVRQFLYGIYS